MKREAVVYFGDRQSVEATAAIVSIPVSSSRIVDFEKRQ